MDQQLQIELLEELRGLGAEGDFFIGDAVHRSPIERYTSETRFQAEMDHVFRALPMVAAHASELAEPGSYLTVRLAGLPVLLTRDKSGQANAFLNVCRHRGARLVGDGQGCKKVFSCPYHGWTWDAAGQLRGVPHEKEGFPELDRSQYGLRRLPMAERLGMIWVVPDPDAQFDFDAFLSPLQQDFDWLGMAGMVVAESEDAEYEANWKLLAEGGIEAYHFRITHRDTIGPHFMDNLSSYQMLGAHMRSILPRTSIEELEQLPRENWSIRDHANVLYTLMPSDQFLLMQDHVAWIHAEPLSAGRTALRIATLVPKEDFTPDRAGHWKRNHAITKMTLAEDFDVNEAVQSGLASGANSELNFGRFESALHKFNSDIEARLPG
ncbi:SRPBCC family protein [Maricaulis sp.]|uniref:aromatic ring-hydroxylating oxygenase subunit alpha n=1 Tax=Maricaulis sp. TaxID=1486257 RepID=UPI00260906EC|nr:SRPBCC family protein [Maricaulis sp.]